MTPGLPGDTLTELTGPAGAVRLANGVVSFAAPANASGNVAFSYRISDQLGDVSAVVSDTLAVGRHDHGWREGRARHHRRDRHPDRSAPASARDFAVGQDTICQIKF